MGNCCSGRNQPNSIENTEPSSNKHNKLKHQKTEGSSADYELNIDALTELAKSKKRKQNLPKTNPELFSPEQNNSDYISIDLESDLIENNQSDSDGEESCDELNYSLYQASEFTKAQQRTILGFFQNFVHEVPSDSENEQLDGFVYITIQNGKSIGKRYILLISTYAIYCIDPDTFSTIHRRIRLDCILLIGLNQDRTHAILHITHLDLHGDLCFSSDKFQDALNAIEVLHKGIKSYYIPAYSVDSPSKLLVNFNSMPSSEIVLYHSRQNLLITEVLFNDGILGENIVFVKPSRRATKSKRFEDCIAVLTDSYLYTLDPGCKFLDKIKLSSVETAYLVDKSDRLILHSNEFENVMWFWSSHFLSILEKVVAKSKRKGIQVEYINMNQANAMMEFLTEPQSARLPKKNLDLEESKWSDLSHISNIYKHEPRSALLPGQVSHSKPLFKKSVSMLLKGSSKPPLFKSYKKASSSQRGL